MTADRTEAASLDLSQVPFEPYYRDHHCVIYNADCRKVLPFLPKFDLLLTDPPYGLGDRMKGGTWGCSEKYEVMRKWDQETPPQYLLEQSIECAKLSIVWGGNYFRLPPARCLLLWDKSNAVPTMASAEVAWTSFDMPVRTFRGKVGEHNFGHSTEKPLALFRWCLSLAPEAKTILDCFAGSLTTLHAAKLENRFAVGIEINESYCENAVKRLEQGVLF